jgi:hypothetical protein
MFLFGSINDIPSGSVALHCEAPPLQRYNLRCRPVNGFGTVAVNAYGVDTRINFFEVNN